IDKISKELSKVTKKLSNEDFLAKAPEEIIEIEKVKARELKAKHDKLGKSLIRIKKLVSEVR
ncbi:MAG: hypothetical protein KAQ81_06170, partial [Deltaproteobacteria bacterium]|nr:hypothetical protein [Deltaproteobacteria bacterium]